MCSMILKETQVTYNSHKHSLHWHTGKLTSQQSVALHQIWHMTAQLPGLYHLKQTAS